MRVRLHVDPFGDTFRDVPVGREILLPITVRNGTVYTFVYRPRYHTAADGTTALLVVDGAVETELIMIHTHDPREEEAELRPATSSTGRAPGCGVT